jgi:ADP-ribosylglycohydrolase
MGQKIGFKRAIIEACCCGGDADTIASIAGQIMGVHGVPLPDIDLARLKSAVDTIA